MQFVVYSFSNQLRVHTFSFLFTAQRNIVIFSLGYPKNNTKANIRYGRISLRRLGVGSSRKEGRFHRSREEGGKKQSRQRLIRKQNTEKGDLKSI